MIKICHECGEDIAMGWCSYECLLKRAEKEGKSPDELMDEMNEDVKKIQALQKSMIKKEENVENNNKNGPYTNLSNL